MKFYGEPGLLVRNTRKNGPLKKWKGFRFDENGEYETDNKHVISLLQTKFKAVEAITPEVIESAPQVDSEPINGMDDDSVRALGKARKIKHWHIMSIEKLKKELEG